ncbi:glutathione S-transferase C-terminal domain-containing protein [uncultured Erythrobacter sp.]|uniref:glutathione S-transferase C-terminal domain-containing protein n=1 Tax=uncultured Erythrobacter sp. TaxID=263913 RepID=UPI00261E253F|nr:glutathione S-transferase C-terminal domain-containing protein [uncultured Erythrobacter sp.]
MPAARVELTGSPGSPYTRKMIALLRYRRIPYSIFWDAHNIPDGYPHPKLRMLPIFFFPEKDGAGRTAAIDSTPIIRRLESDFSERSVIPSNPTLSFLCDLIEDYADEWLSKAMFHYRWSRAEDAKNAGPLLTFWTNPTMPAGRSDEVSEAFAKRQISRLHVVGSNEGTANAIEESFTRFISILDTLLERGGFVLGSRPSAADFAIYGQLTQLMIIDPTPASVGRDISARVRAWLDIVEDLSGLEVQPSDWFSVEAIQEVLAPLLQEIGRTYAPVMVANAAASQKGAPGLKAEVDGNVWKQASFSYQAKCLRWLQDAHEGLPTDARDSVNELLSGTGCEQLFESLSGTNLSKAKDESDT